MRINRRALVRTLNEMKRVIPTPDDRLFDRAVKRMTSDELRELEDLFQRHGVAYRDELPADVRLYVESIMAEALTRTVWQQPNNSFTTAAPSAA